MGIIDEQGRLFGRVSIIDLLIILAVIGLGLGYVYKKTSGEVQQIINADKTFYVTYACEQLREFTMNAVDEGDIFYRQYDRQPLGTVVKTDAEPAQDILYKTDGTAVLVPIEDRYAVYITLECKGSITDTGYYIYGSLPVAEGVYMAIQSNRLYLEGYVYEVSEDGAGY